ncbi:Gfo/Idh/MocA family oxidoreductase [uncultured Alsobacter sp.]|uniref:Gfo/Idh/MocA family protein n=1 Tax=uncultured Alsobacter sp. TaxID=1748258 RepID=UPI0025E542B3|nr:Gfo/Idh/MocA family oxidoreductase [uncultured Alsobacter sp.]
MPSIVFIGLAHWHVGMHLAGARRAGLDVLGGWDPDPARAASHGVPGFPSLEAALQAGATLACVTGTPLEMPERLTRTAQAGVPALVEKPIAPTGAALRQLAEELAATGAWVAVALPHHAGPLSTVDCGDVRHLSVRLVNGRPARYRDWGVPWVLDPAVGGGGALRNLGVHGLDLARLLLGPQVRVTGASLRRWHGEAVEDHAVVHLAAPGGATATVEAGYLHPDDGGSDFEARLMGTGAVAVDTGHALVVHASSGAIEHRPVTPQPSRYDDLMADVARRAAGGHPPAASLLDLAGAMDLIDDAYRKADTA